MRHAGKGNGENTVIELGDCGGELTVKCYDSKGQWSHSACVKVCMVIKAPRGTMALFGTHKEKWLPLQVETIKSFVEQYTETR